MERSVAAIWKKKPALLLTIGTAFSLVAGGATAWWLLQRHTPISELPSGADILPQNTAVSFSFSTDEGQWRRLRQFGNDQTQASMSQRLATWRDRLLTENGINYQQDVQPWVGEEITVAFLNPDVTNSTQGNEPGNGQGDEQGTAKEIRPYQLPNEAEFERSAVLILPIANPERVQQFISQPQVTDTQEWADREYNGVTIREVHGDTQLDYAAALLGDRFLVASGDVQSLEQVIDTFKGDAAIARNVDYGRAFSQLQETVSNPFMRLYVNVPEAKAFTATNANQPIPPQLLTLVQNNEGLVAAVTLESNGMRFQGSTWVASDSKIRLRGNDEAERTPVLLPTETVMMASGANFEQFWQTYGQASSQALATPNSESPVNLRNQGFSAATIQQLFANFTGLNWAEDILPWAKGEFSLSLLSAPAATPTAPSTAGLLFMVQVSDRRAADEALKKLDQAMTERNGWAVAEAQLEGQPIINWTSPRASLTVTRGWLEGNVMYLAIGPGVAEAIAPTPTNPLFDSDLFRTATATNLPANSGQFFLAVDQLANPNINLPVPNLPTTNRDFLSVMRAIGITTAIQDNRTLRYDLHVLLQKTDSPPPPLPSPQASTQPSPASPSPNPDSPNEPTE